ncbi:hypothetical protein [Sphingopyxis fribergensis]
MKSANIISLLVLGLVGWPDIGACQTLTPSEAAQALTAATDNDGPPNLDLAPLIVSEDLIKPTMAIDVTSDADVFTRVERLNGVSDIALLDDGRVARWTLELVTNASGVQYLGKLKGVAIGDSPKAVGYDGLFRFREKSPPPPRNVPCDLIDATEVRSPSLSFPYVAACRAKSAQGGTNIVLYDLSGKYRTAAHHALPLSRISMDWGMHGGRGRLGILTSPDNKGKIYLQQYSW